MNLFQLLTLKRPSSSSWECFSVNGSERYAPIATAATHASVASLGATNEHENREMQEEICDRRENPCLVVKVLLKFRRGPHAVTSHKTKADQKRYKSFTNFVFIFSAKTEKPKICVGRSRSKKVQNSRMDGQYIYGHYLPSHFAPRSA